MKALVVYESMFGNTRDIALAVADGLAHGVDVQAVEVGRAPAPLPAELDLLVVGAPTHAFSLSRSSTRRSALDQATQPLVSPGIGVREWLDRLPRSDGSVAVATFDTKAAKPRLPGSAARAAAKRLRRRGYDLAGRPESFYVTGMTGPLLEDEVERARWWGEHLLGMVASSPVASPADLRRAS